MIFNVQMKKLMLRNKFFGSMSTWHRPSSLHGFCSHLDRLWMIRKVWLHFIKEIIRWCEDRFCSRLSLHVSPHHIKGCPCMNKGGSRVLMWWQGQREDQQLLPTFNFTFTIMFQGQIVLLLESFNQEGRVVKCAQSLLSNHLVFHWSSITY